jgi:pimeloyl-ACP methyl ester carboxylesterase
MKRALLLLAAIAAAVVPVQALHQAGHLPPSGPAKVRFAADFPHLTDTEWEFPVGGFGGIRRGTPLKHVPVILVHGNTVDHADWYPVRDAFKKAGWTDQEVWALAYNGLGANAGSYESQPNPERSEEHTEMGGDGVSRQTNNDTNVPDLYAFIQAVRAYTGSERFSIVSHSLGVTLARKTLKVHPELRADLVTFVGISGANHGTSLCAPGTEGVVMSCDEIAADTAWLDALNGPDGADETYGPAKWLTVYDSSGMGDIAFLGPYAESPNLKGSTAMTFPGTSHNEADARDHRDLPRLHRNRGKAFHSCTFREDEQAVGSARARREPAVAAARPGQTAGNGGRDRHDARLGSASRRCVLDARPAARLGQEPLPDNERAGSAQDDGGRDDPGDQASRRSSISFIRDGDGRLRGGSRWGR